MRILMFGWEFPPFRSGGLGTACYDLTKGLNALGEQVTFVMPVLPENSEADFVNLVSARKHSQNIKVRKVGTILTPYMTSESYSDEVKKVRADSKSSKEGAAIYGNDIYEEVYRYGEAAKEIASEEPHDVIHVHDWMTYQAGINARAVSGKPLVAHIHATEYDRTGGNPNPYIAELEKKGMDAADMVIANSEFTKNNVLNVYDIDPNKIKVVHWGIDPTDSKYHTKHERPIDEKVILYMGRVTPQKGVEFFVRAAKKVLEQEKDVKFMIAGEGYSLPSVLQEIHDAGLMDRFLFEGWLTPEFQHRAMQMADLLVMPSTSEPFGLQALEAMANDTPVIASKQSGFSEVVRHCLKVDFWDVDEMASKMIGVLRHPEMYGELKKNSYVEVQGFSIEEPARKTLECYKEAVGGGK